MAILHIEHPITDGQRYVLIDPEFDTVASAESFLQSLKASVWAKPASAPALAGEPLTKILELVRTPALPGAAGPPPSSSAGAKDFSDRQRPKDSDGNGSVDIAGSFELTR